MDKILKILKEKLGTGLLLVQKVKCDNGTNLHSNLIRVESESCGIEIYTLSAYHPSRNLLVETAIKRCKQAIMNNSIDDASMDLMALNTAEVSGIPVTPTE